MKKSKLDVKEYGGFLITKSVLENEDIAAFWFREESSIQELNGWNILGLNDSKEYLEQAENWAIVEINTVFEIMPFVLNIFEMPVGTDLQVVFGEGLPTKIYDVNKQKYLFNINTDKSSAKYTDNKIKEKHIDVAKKIIMHVGNNFAIQSKSVVILNDEISLKLVTKFSNKIEVLFVINSKLHISIINNKGEFINEFIIDYNDDEKFKQSLSTISQTLKNL